MRTGEEKTMIKKRLTICVLTALIFAASGLSLRAEDDTTKVVGNFEFGYRYVNVSGNINKYNEDLNYRKGPRLLALNLDLLSSGTLRKYFDVFSVYATTIGGDPFETYGFTLKKYGAFNLRYSHRKSTYFYKDFLVPASQVNIRLENAGDFHTFNFDHTFDNLYFDVNLTSRAKFFISYDRQNNSGASTTTIDTIRDLFEFDRPMDNTKNLYQAGLQVNLDQIDFTLQSDYADYRNQSSLFLPGFSTGENPVTSDLFFFELNAPYKFTMPRIMAKVNARPGNRLRATLAYSYSNQDLSLNYDERAKGIDQSRLPFEYETVGKADLNRKLNLADFDLSYKVHEKVYLIGGFRYNKLSQTGDLVIDAENTATSVDIKTSIYEAGAQVLPYRTLSITGGIRYEKRDVTRHVADEEPDFLATKRTTFFINANYDISKRLNLLAEYERGSFKDPFTIMSPTGLDRFKIRGKIKATEQLSFIFTMLKRDSKNDELGGKFNSTTCSIDGTYTMKERFTISAGYSRLDMDRNINNLVNYAPVTKLWDIRYKGRNNVFQGSLSYKINPNLSIGAMSYYYKNSGTWPLDWTTFRGWIRYTLNSGYSLVFSYQRNNYNEVIYNFDDYSSDIFTLGFGYRF